MVEEEKEKRLHMEQEEADEEREEEQENFIQLIAGRISYLSPEIGAFVRRLDDDDDDEIFVPIEVIRQTKVGVLSRGSLVKIEKTRRGIQAIMPLD